MSEEPLQVLLVDDEPSLLEPLAKYLRDRCGYCVDTAADAAQAWQRTTGADRFYDVALIDDMLTPEAGAEPELVGIDLMKQIKTRCPQTECIVFTGWGMERALEALRAGAYRYLAKPLNMDELGMTIRTAAEHRRLKQQLETTKQEKEWLQTFFEIGAAATSSLELEEVLERIHEQVGRLMDVSGLDVILYDEHSGTLRFELGYDRGEKEDNWERPFTPGEGLTDWVIEHCRPLLIRDYWNEETLVPAYQRGEISRSWLGVPLVARDRVIGAITVQSYAPGQFDETHQQILVTVASHVAGAIENARLFSELAENKEWREALVENAFDAVIAIDQDKHITVFNRCAEEMFGWTAEEIIGRTVARLHTDVEKAREILDLINRTGAVSGWEVALQRRDGTPVPALLSATLIQDSDGRPIGQAGFMRDLRRVKLLEERLRALIQVSQTIAGILELDQVLIRVIQAAVAAFPAAHQGSIHLHDARADMLCPRAIMSDYSPSAMEALFLRPGEGIAGWVFQHRQPAVVEDTLQDPRYKRIDHPEVPIFKSMLCVPLRVRDQVIGTLSLDNREITGAFQAEDLGLLFTFADQAAIAIDNARLYQEAQRRQQLLTALDEASRHIRAEKETPKLLHEVVRLAAQLVDCAAGSLFINRPRMEELELRVVYGLPGELVGSRLSHAEGLAGLVARTGDPQVVDQYVDWPHREIIFESCGFSAVAGVPLKQAGEVEAVLLVADSSGRQRFMQSDLEILERFAAQAAIALQTSRLMNREQRMVRRLGILHQISDYIQTAGDLDKILHVVLTGVTAGYGLGFNRAVLLLLDERGEYLVGRMGIGHLEEPQARRDWAQHHERGLEDFQRYLELLELGSLPSTPIGDRIRQVRLPVTAAGCALFAQALREQRRIVLTQDELDGLSDSFVEAFEPALPFVVAPLIARGQTIGLLVADNKFTESPITPEDEETLLTFASTAAVAIENAQLYRRARVEQERLRSFYEASSALVSSQDFEQVLHDIVERARLAARACGVSMVLIDEADQVRKLITAGADEPINLAKMVRKNGLSLEVMRTGQPAVIEDSEEQRDRVNPSMFRRKIAAALCLPVSIEGRRVGVMWVHYDKPRRFSTPEIEAAQLYVNQAALAYDSAWRIKELEHMRQAAEALAGVAGLQEVLKQIVRSARNVLQADSAAIWSYDDVRDKFILESSVSSGIPAELWREFRQEEPRLGRTAHTVMERGWIGVTDVADVERYGFLGESTRSLLDQIGVQSFQGIALAAGDEKLGVLYVNYNYHRGFYEEEQEIARTFANHAALALKKARLLDQVSRARDTARIVAEVSVLEDLRSTLRSIVRGTQNALHCDAVTLYTFDQNRDEFTSPPEIIGVRDTKVVLKLGLAIRESVVRRILALEEAYVAEDAPSDPVVGAAFVEREGIKSSVSIPLRVGDYKVGVMFVNYRSRHRFTGEELTNIRLFATQAAIAIRNARLLADVSHRGVQLQTVAEVSKSTGTILNPKELMNQAVNLIREGFDFCYVGLFLVDEVGEYAVLQAGTDEAGQKMLQEGHKLAVGGKSMVGWSVANARARIAPDVGQEAIHFDNPHLPETRSEMALPLISRGKCIGALTVQSAREAAFSEEDVAALQTMADQLAIAIDNARLYQAEQQRVRMLAGLHSISRTIRSLADIREVYQRVNESMAMLIGVEMCAILLYDEAEGALVCQLPMYGVSDEIGQQYRIPVGEGAPAAIWETEDYLILNDVEHYPLIGMLGLERLARESGLRDTLLAKLMVGNRSIGVVQASNKLDESVFNEDDARLLRIFANQAAAVIENARLYEELKRTKGLVGARTALAWVGMVSSTWRHAIGNQATTIQDLVKLTRRDVAENVASEQILARLDRVDEMATKIQATPITAPLQVEEGVSSVSIDELLRERVKQLRKRESFEGVQFALDWGVKESITVRASPDWLRRAFDILLDNAADAMANSTIRKLTIESQLVDNNVKLAITDTGTGVPKQVLPKLFQAPISKPKGSKGLGVGLLMAHAIIQAYGGDIRLGATSPSGTTMIVWLPVERETGVL